MNVTIIAVLIGAVSGIVAALCGVGGGVVMVPAFVMLFKMNQKVAVSTSLAAIVLTAIFTSLKNHSNGFIQWKIALPAGIAGAAVGWFAADLLKKLQDVALTRIFATLIIVFGIQMWWQSLKKADLSSATEPKIFENHEKN